MLSFSRSKTDIYISKLKPFAMIGMESVPFNIFPETLPPFFVK